MNPKRIPPQSLHWAEAVCRQIENDAMEYEFWLKAWWDVQDRSEEQCVRRWGCPKAGVAAKLLKAELLFLETPLKDPFD